MSQDTATIELSVRDMGDFDAQKNERASIIIYGPEGVEVVHLSSPHETVVVGRAHPSDICISDPSLSRQHARFRWSDDELTVTDLESQNGVWIGKKRVKNALLSSGEQIRLGGISIIVAIKADPHHSRHSAFEKNAGGKSFIVLNPKMKELYREVERAALVDANVLILGETGTGKDHVAQSIHALGRLRDKRFVTVNCGAIHRELLDSQLFGYEKGAFTGAAKSNPGFFEEAQGGVLFLDEIGELSLSAQAALLRAVETKTITRLGSTKEIEVNVRIVAATHCRLEAMTREGTFREDLYFRLNTIVFELPPLRERIDEIQPLSELFLKSACEAWGQPPKRLHPAVPKRLEQYRWPGNIRQLRNTIERAVLSARGETIEMRDLPPFIVEAEGAAVDFVPPTTLSPPADEKTTLSFKERLRQWETSLISEAMHRANGSQRAAARFLRIPRSTLVGKLEALGLSDKSWGRKTA